jgi:glycosyltransferase involved in cell wall biosynthesis
VGYQVDLLASTLVGRGHEVTVFQVDEPPAECDYRCVQVPLRRHGRARRIFAVGRAFAAVDTAGFDVVHAHGDDWSFGRRRRVRTFYGSALMEARTATSWLRRCSQLCHYPLEWVSSAGGSSVAISQATRRYLPLVRHCVPCAYDPKVTFPGGERSADPSILFVAGTLSGRKRGDLLLRAFDEVRRALPAARLTIVSLDRVERPGVTCLSDVDGATLGRLYRSHWLLCSASSYEGFGVPYVEALASGLPVVTTRNGGAQEVLGAPGLGVLCSPEDLGREMLALIGDRARRERLGAVGLEASKRYSIDVVAAEYEAIYACLAARADRNHRPGTGGSRHAVPG